MAQPEIRVAAEMMLEAYNTNEPRPVREGEWHLPLIQDEERDGLFEFSEEAQKISAARCARVSYLTHDGKRDLQADLDLYKRLVSSGHMSPLEHVATPFTLSRWALHSKFREFVEDYTSHASDEAASLLHAAQFSGNFRGWTQLRKLIPNEHNFSLVERS